MHDLISKNKEYCKTESWLVFLLYVRSLRTYIKVSQASDRLRLSASIILMVLFKSYVS